ncbi:MAG: O-antigen ligase family protein, partial [Anaerolineae bacterium]|nr:O-antigen ligase family protein [Anaerolineae bacterium]
MVFQRQFAVQLLVIVVMIYALLVGGTFNGLVSVEISQVSLLMLTGGLLGWLALRRWRRFRWQPTVLDGLALAALGVLVLTTLPNLESWRRIVIGAWYWGVYLLAWWMLADLLAHGLARRWLVNALLIAGGLMIVLGYVQVYPWLLEWASLKPTGIMLPFSPPRPSSVIGNPNALGTFLIVVILLALGRLAQARRWPSRILWGGYVILGGGLLVLTLSRGAWAGAALGGTFWLVMMAANGGMLSGRFWREWWAQASRSHRAALVAGGLLAAAVVAVGGIMVLRLGSQPGRNFQATRAIVYNAALEEFKARPLTGSGLFTFGKQLLSYHSTPPQTPHSHAHNLFLHIGAELGLPGLLLLGWFAVVMARAWWHRLRQVVGAARLEHIALGGAILAVIGHHLFDITLMMPALVLVLLLLLACVVPEESPESHVLSSRHWQTALVLASAAVVIITGWGSQRIQQRYFDALRLANSGAWQEAARALGPVVPADPALPLYAAQQGYIWGVAAYPGDNAAAAEGIAALGQALAAEDTYAPWHANQAALYRQIGDDAAAQEAMYRAIAHAPRSGVLWLNRGLWAEQDGDLPAAREAYAHVLEATDAFGLPFWGESPLRQEVRADYLARLEVPPMLQEVVNLLEVGQGEAAMALLLEAPPAAPDSAWWRVMMAITHDVMGETELADLWLQSAPLYQQTGRDAVWLAVGQAALAVFRDD